MLEELKGGEGKRVWAVGQRVRFGTRCVGTKVMTKVGMQC